MDCTSTSLDAVAVLWAPYGGHTGCGISFETLLEAYVLIILLGVLKSLENVEHFNGSVLPVVQVKVRAKVRAKLARLTFIWYSLVFRPTS